MFVNSIKSNISFGRELKSPKETGQFNDICNKAKNLIGQTGKSIFIVHDACLPQSANKNTGAGNLSSDESQAFFNYMKTYLGFNTVEVLPPGEIKPNNGLYCPYSGSSLSLGNHQINLELLTQSEFEKILLPEEYSEVVASNTSPDKESIVNYNNIMDKNSAQEVALKKAYARFKNLGEETGLKKDFKNFISKNNDWLEPKIIFNALEKKYGTDAFAYWDANDSMLYSFCIKPEDRNARITQILKENTDEAEFYKFKQFLAQKHLEIGRKKLNNMGINLTGDCEIGFSKDEIWANPNAFKEGTFIGQMDWSVPCLDFDSIIKKEGAGADLLKRKVQLCAERYDSIRFDVGWAYFNPKIHQLDGTFEPKYLGESVLGFIEDAVKEVKGQNYDLKNLIYEFQGGDIFDYRGKLYEPVKKRVGIFDSVYMKDTSSDIWASNYAFLKRGWHPDNFVMGVGNHDSQPLRQIANNVRDIIPSDDNGYHKKLSVNALSKIFKTDETVLQNPVEFAKAKWAEPMMAKNNMMFYMDVFGREERFNMHHLNTSTHPKKNFAYKIPSDYKKAYHKAVQEGYGFNIMDSFEKIFKLKGLDKKEPELYAQIVKFRDILYEKDEIKSVKNNVKNNKYLKPLLIIASAAAITALLLTTIFKKKPEKTPQNTTPKTILQTAPKINMSMNDFINGSLRK